jgi:two-component sensor histidine kinase
MSEIRQHRGDAANGRSVDAGDAARVGDAPYRSLLDSNDEGFCIIEVIFGDGGKPDDYRFLEVNPAFERQTGLSGAVGKTMRQLAPGHEARWIEIYSRVALTGHSERFENRAGALDRWYDVDAFCVGDPGDRRVGVLFRDVLERKRAEAALRDSEVRFRASVTASTDAVYRMSPDWSQMRQLDGQGFITGAGEPTQSWTDRYIPPEDQPVVHAAVEKAIASGSIFELEHRVRRADGTLGWTLSRAIPIRDDRGQITEWLGAATDITARREVQEALRESEERQVFLLQLSDRLRSATDPLGAMSAAAELFARRTGLAVVHYLLIHPDGDRFDVVAGHNDGRLPVAPWMQSGRISDHAPGWWGPQFRRGEAVFLDDHDNRSAAGAEARRAFGTRSGSAVPLIRGGRLVGVLSTADPEPRRWTAAEKMLQREVAERTWAAVERTRAELALSESEERFRLSLVASEMGTFVWYVSEDRGEPDAKMRELFGLPADGELNLAVALGRLIHPDDRAHYAEAVARAADPEGDGVLRDDIRIICDDDGAERWIAVTGQTEFAGNPRRAFRIHGMAQDITDRKAANDRQRLLLAELQHRVRNTLATVRSIIRRSTETAETVDGLSMHLEGRITALARTQVILTRNPGAGIDLETIVREELLAQSGAEKQVGVDGPIVELSPKAAEVIALALHELAANSIKYGALKDEAGRIAITWRTEERADETWLRLAWVESKVRIIAAGPRREGFGMELITSRVPYELSGTGSLELRPGGIHATIAFPLRPGSSILEPARGR